MAENNSALLLFSGGQDSATCLAWAVENFTKVETVGFDYGQRHRSELEAAARVAKMLGAIEHRVMEIPIGELGGSALTDSTVDIPNDGGDRIPITYVPARNTVFLALALAWVEVLSAKTIMIGVNAVDYSGYPDCRPEFINAFQALAALATKQAVEGRPVTIEAPLVNLTKAQIIQAGYDAGVDYALTVSCYTADAEGRACGQCDSCRFRRQGFSDAGMEDPTRYRV